MSGKHTEKFVDNDGYLYIHDHRDTNSKVIYWCCDQKHNGCKARIHTNATMNEVVKVTNMHNHSPCALSTKVSAIQGAIINKTRTIMENTSFSIEDDIAALNSPSKISILNSAVLEKAPRINTANSLSLSNKDIQASLSSADQRNLIETLIKDAGAVLSPISNNSNPHSDDNLITSESVKKNFTRSANCKKPLNISASACLTTQRQRDKLMDDHGYMYTFEKASSDFKVKFWRCDQRNYGCKVRLHTDACTNDVIKVMHAHNHDMDAVTAEVASFKCAVKKRAKTSFDKPSLIISEEIAAIGSTVASSAINRSSLKRTIQRHRSLNAPSPDSLVLFDPFDSSSYHPGSTVVAEQELSGVKDEIRKLQKRISFEDEARSTPSAQQRLVGSRKRKNSHPRSARLFTNQPQPDEAKDEAEVKSPRLSALSTAKRKTRPRRRFIDDDGFHYGFDKESMDKRLEFWRCERRHLGCKARIHVDPTNNKIVSIIHSHNHDVDAFSAHVSFIHEAIKKRAQESTASPSEIINEFLPDVDPSALPALRPANLRKKIQRLRNVTESMPPSPTCFEDLHIPHQYNTYTSSDGKEENFLLHDSGSSFGSERILIFGKKSNLECVRDSKVGQVVYMDGTFRLSQELYKNGQMYVLLLSYQDWMLPLLFALLPNKKRETYDKFLSLLRSIMPEFKPSTIFMDYELNFYEALKVSYPSASLHGAPYHFAKAMYRYLASLPSALKRYRTEPAYAIKCKAVAAIPYVPLDCLDLALKTLREHLLPELRFLVTWLQDIYVGCDSGDDEKCVPLFSPSVWNAHHRMMLDQDMMTNHAEGAFRRLKGELGFEHTNIWKLIDNIKKAQKSRDLDYQEMLAGNDPPRKRNRFSKADLRIVKLLKKFLNSEKHPLKMWDLLQGVACNIEIEP